jgi:hypothetical protein
MRSLSTVALILWSPSFIQGFVPLPPAASQHQLVGVRRATEGDDGAVIDAEITERKEIVGNLVADDEWAGVTMELSQLIRKSIEEDLKQKAREFLGKPDYALGDMSKEIDARVKQGVADIRGKDDYEIGDLVLSLDEMSKNFTETLTGKPYEPGDLSVEIDTRVKGAVAQLVGKEEYVAGDLTKFVAANVQNRVAELTANYEFGDISREIERQRKEWVKGFLGEEAAANYKFGDISRKLATKITGQDEYRFGDVTKTLLGNMFNKKKDK